MRGLGRAHRRVRRLILSSTAGLVAASAVCGSAWAATASVVEETFMPSAGTRSVERATSLADRGAGGGEQRADRSRPD